ncbi:hypothetical protein PQX77_021962 [Marasmius sp. AFHP31]|nr:hypothetical protein PQX77_021962 [Marasmius sp. AFHP31]
MPSSLPPGLSLPKPDRPKWKPPVQPVIGGKGSVTGDEGDCQVLLTRIGIMEANRDVAPCEVLNVEP